MTYIQSRPGRKSRWTRGRLARNKVPVILPEGFCDSRLRVCVWRFFLSPIAFLFVGGAGALGCGRVVAFGVLRALGAQPVKKPNSWR